jgi:pantothenate kinase
MKLAKAGDNRNIDLIVKDIYGSNANNLGLDDDVIASSFGKIGQIIQSKGKENVNKEDIAKSLLSMICFHIGQLAYLICKQYSVKK